MRRIWTLLVAVLLTGLLTATTVACTADESGAPTREAANGDTVNDADVEFAAELLRHDAESLLLVDTTLGRELDSELAAVVESTREELLLSIEEMAALLEEWGEEVPETARDHTNSHAEDEDDFHPWDDLAAAPQEEFQRVWIAEMTSRHQDAAALATTAAEDGLAVTERAAGVEAARSERAEELAALPIG
ncbi:DUF305 domain-containing protein [Nocardioides sp.]|uniref:DUF305 domain-containing protein n=1 Tax=Nocardioides sp. TaxID=35761 RepID=UPI0027324EEF|nr:DUF305 domain-containing protein [Nocardioides sp.]MDP3892635.1 DUF305 domain-containing protein [Nocardioides sp.]